MPQIFWHDWSGRESIRTFFENYDGTKIIDPAEVSKVKIDREGAIVFVHVERKGDFEKWRDIAKGTVHVVRMSRQPSSLGIRVNNDNIHFCEYRADELSQHGKVKRFFDSVKENKSPDWSLLVLEPCPEPLVAAYLLLFVASRNDHLREEIARIAVEGKDADRLRGFWGEVVNECGIRGWKGLNVPSNWELFDAMDRETAEQWATAVWEKLSNSTEGRQ